MNQRVYTFANYVTDFCPVLMPNNNRKAVTDYQAGRQTKDVTERQLIAQNRAVVWQITTNQGLSFLKQRTQTQGGASCHVFYPVANIL
jgi:hypothetical protein